MANKGFRYVPLHQLDRPQLQQRLKELHTRLYKDYPWWTIPPIYIPMEAELSARNPENLGAKAMDKKLDENLTTGAYVKTGGAPGLMEANAVILNHRMLNVLTDDELFAVIAHEYGHHFRRHHDRETLPRNECEADQFMAYYVKDGAALMESATRKKLVYYHQERMGHPKEHMDGILKELYKMSSAAYPTFNNRIKMMSDKTIISIDPDDVKLNDSCERIVAPVTPRNTEKDSQLKR